MRTHRMNYHRLIIFFRYPYLFYEYIFLNLDVDAADSIDAAFADGSGVIEPLDYWTVDR